jgi:hypothetical protein
MKHSEQVRRLARGYIKPPKLRGEGKLALSTFQLIERLYVLRNAQDSEIAVRTAVSTATRYGRQISGGRVRSKNP